jgi:hypothetical protein
MFHCIIPAALTRTLSSDELNQPTNNLLQSGYPHTSVVHTYTFIHHRRPCIHFSSRFFTILSVFAHDEHPTKKELRFTKAMEARLRSLLLRSRTRRTSSTRQHTAVFVLSHPNTSSARTQKLAHCIPIVVITMQGQQQEQQQQHHHHNPRVT